MGFVWDFVVERGFSGNKKGREALNLILLGVVFD